MLTAIVILLFAGTVLFDFLPKMKNEPPKNKAVYIALISVSFIVLVLFSFEIIVPSPAGLIKSVVKSIFKVQ